MLDPLFDAGFAREYGVVCGTDEAGRGPLAGPVVAAAVVLPEGLTIPGLDDSKKLTEKKREALYDVILREAAAYGIAESSPEEIDRINILAASLLAMRRAVEQVRRTIEPGIVLVDGNRPTEFGIPCRTVVKGDGISQSIAAASVLAKVTRDRLMTELDLRYPAYGFAEHKGYPTKEHKLAVYEFGPSPVHRRSFLSFLERDRDQLENALREKREEEAAERPEDMP
ncbi:MAG: ribonuclease HII [Clostridia bacterium]|nr:ribonuclease HII [Clostridia bacterium]